MYKATKPKSVNRVFPEETVGETPSLVFNKPYTKYGCLPHSAVYQPVKFATYGKGTKNLIAQSKGLTVSNWSLHKKNMANAIIPINLVPTPTTMRHA